MRWLVLLVVATGCTHDLAALAGHHDGGIDSAGLGGSMNFGSGGHAGEIGTGDTTTIAGTGGFSGTGGMGTGGRVGSGGADNSVGGNAVDPDLVLWYRFDESTGTSATDSSGHGQTGTLASMGTGTVTFSPTHAVGTGSINMTGQGTSGGGYVVVPQSLQSMGA